MEFCPFDGTRLHQIAETTRNVYTPPSHINTELAGPIDSAKFRSSFRTFERLDAMNDFSGFWRWKLKIETGDSHILDSKHRGETYKRLRQILPRWLAYRPFNSTVCLETLEGSLKRMSEVYNQIRNYSLLEFDKIEDESLETVWHELGRAKEDMGKRSASGYYYIVSVTKPLMFLWGQTLAFDSLVRKCVPKLLGVPDQIRWDFKDWQRVLGMFQQELRRSVGIVDLLNETSLRKYGTDSIVPYGQFLDLYYWIEGKSRKRAR